MQISHDGLKFIEKWEEKVPYVYDDKIPKRRIGGVLKYPEWDGSAFRGTLTIGYGHTDAAGYPKIHQGLRFTDEECDETLTADLKPCISAVNRILAKMGIRPTQGQFDTLSSFTFNCGEGNLAKLLRGITAANFNSAVPVRLMQYVNSKGERMQGLVNRRTGEIRMWGKSEDPEEVDSTPIPSTAERIDAPKKMLDSKTGNASILTGGAGAAVTIEGVNSATSTLKDTKSNFQDLGVMDYLGQAIHQPIFWIGVVIVLIGGYIYYDRHKKLEEERV